MKKLIAAIMFLVFLTLPLSANAGSCEHYWDELVEQCFVTTIEDIEYTACFKDVILGPYPVGPCPEGIVTLEYIDIQDIDGIPYESLISLNLNYMTSQDYVIVEELVFILIDGRLILVPEDPLIFEKR